MSPAFEGPTPPLLPGGAFTLIVNDAVPLLPDASTASQTTVVSPTGNKEPEDGAQEIVISLPISSCQTLILFSSSSNVTVPSTLSCAITEYVIRAPSEMVASLVMVEGTVMRGSISSNSVESLATCPLSLIKEGLTKRMILLQ